MATKGSEEWETTEVLIVGGGPTRAFLSCLLGRMSKSNIVLEKETELYPYPRTFTLGEDGLREYALLITLPTPETHPEFPL